MPFFPTNERDDGYDITDFYGVDERLGSHGDFVEFIRTAKDRGMRVIVDLVVNHTSEKHPWFVASRSSLDNPYRDFYVWRDKPPAKQAATVFPGEETSVWEKDEKTGQYYLHSFYQRAARPQRREPAGARRDRQGHRVLAGARDQRVPGRRRPVPHRAAGGHRRSATRTSTCATCAGSCSGGRATRSCSAR